MAVTTPRDQVWESMVFADFRVRYFGELATQYRRRQRRLNITLAILSSSAFVVLALRLGVELELPWLAEAAALLVAVLGWLLALGRYSERSSLAASLVRRWSDLHTQYRALWLSLEEMEDREIRSRWQELEESQGEIDQTAASEFPHKRRLANRVYDEMLDALPKAA